MGRKSITYPATHPLARSLSLASPQSIESANPLSIKGVISLAGVLDLKEAAESKLGGNLVYQLLNTSSLDSLYPLVSPQAMLPPDMPVVLFHGTADTEVPLSISQTYALQAREKGGNVEFIPIENADHFIFTSPHGEIWEALLHTTKTLMGAES